MRVLVALSGSGGGVSLFSAHQGKMQTPGTFLPCIAFLLISQAAFAQTPVAARIDWFGIYTLETKPDATDRDGKRSVSTPVKGESTDRIPGKEGVRFGFSYVLSVLSGNKGTKATVRHVYRIPGAGLPSPQGFRSVLKQTRDDIVGDPILIGWSFVGAPPDNIVTGEWSLEVWQGSQKVAEKKFTVIAP
jgi:hypothetical protein